MVNKQEQMKLLKYPLPSREELLTFEFISEGQKGLIHKLVRYQPTNLKDVYNLEFWIQRPFNYWTHAYG